MWTVRGRWIYEIMNGELVNYKDFTHAPEDKHVIVTVFLNGMRMEQYSSL